MADRTAESARSADIEAKVAFLSDPRAYPEAIDRVEVVETHLSWVFLTARYVYKLKKPVRKERLDFRSPAARRRNCVEEVRLNRRFAGDIYIGVVTLSVDSRGQLQLGDPGAEGAAVDWLVHMHRLPADRMLDQLIKTDRVRARDLEPVARLLADFYARAPVVKRSGKRYRARLEREIDYNSAELRDPLYRLSAAQIERVRTVQLRLLRTRAEMFDERMRAGRLVEAHGDLKPEHLCLIAKPVVIDCLEFDRELRTLDPAEELCFLGMECEKTGAAFVGEVMLRVYGERTGDRPSPVLLGFYKSCRAALRARLAVWHLKDEHCKKPAYWRQQARVYLAMAEHYLKSGGVIGP